MSWIFFALLAPVFWSISSFFDKFAVTKLTQGIYDFIFFGTVGGVIVTIFLISVFGVTPLPLYLSIVGVASGALLNYAYILYGFALKSRDTSEIIPLFKLIPIFVLVLGYFFFEEYITFSQFIGFVFVLSGIFILSVHKLPGARTTMKPEFWLMLPASFLIAIGFIFMDLLLEHTTLVNAMIYDSIGFMLATASLFLFTVSRKEIMHGIRTAKLRKYLLFFGNDGADIVGHLFARMALITAPAAGLVSVVGSIQPLYVLGMGYVITIWKPNIIKEDIENTTVVRKFLSIILIIVGIVFVSL